MPGVGLSPLPASRFRPCSHVVGTEARNTVVLLDLASDQYVTLSAVAARMWTLTAQGLNLDAVVERLCEEYEASPNDVSRDLVAQLAEWTARRWIEPAPDGLPRQRPEPVDSGVPETADIIVPSVLYCALAIMVAKAFLRAIRFGGTIAWLRRRVGARPLRTWTDRKVVLDTSWAVALAGALYPGRAKCLEQSLVLYFLLRRHGVSVTYCHGIHPFPFQAHAWVEYESQPINDVPEHTRSYTRLPDLLP